MNTEIVTAIHRLFSACLEVTETGRFHAFLNYSAHIDKVCVYVHPGDTDYQSRGYAAVLDEGVSLSGLLADDPVAELEALTRRVYGLIERKQEAA